MNRHPQIAVAAVIRRNHDILLVQRAHAPNAGLWSVPGGRVKWGETLAQALTREIKEETGLNVACGELIHCSEYLENENDGGYHFVILDFHARIISGSLQAASDAARTGWYSLEEASRLPLARGMAVLLEKLRVA